MSLYHSRKEAMSVSGMSYERAGHYRLEELRRRAFVAAQVRHVTRRPLARLAAALHALATRLEGQAAGSGPWRRDFGTGAADGV